MKFRKDFVTNSSSSSYICDICGRSEEGMDLCLSDAEMYQCENGHTICEDETLTNIMVEDYKDYLNKLVEEDDWFREHHSDELKDEDVDYEELAMDNEFRYKIPEKFCPICNFIEYSQDDLKSYLQNKYKVTDETVFKIVKQVNKRRKKLYVTEYNTYVCQQFNLNPSDIVSNWKYEFGTYFDFKKYLRNK
jgi:hypothetical protein